MNAWPLAALLLTLSLMPADDAFAKPGDDLPLADLSESLEQVMPQDFLRGLFNQALSTLHEYIEVEAALPQGAPPQRRSGEFRLKLFPQGKSRSQDHITAEGGFRLSPDTDQQEFTLRFKSSKKPPHSLPPPSEDVI
jgi:hypothetical protein